MKIRAFRIRLVHFIWLGIVWLFLKGLLSPAITAYRYASERAVIYHAIHDLPLDRLLAARTSFLKDRAALGLPLRDTIPLHNLVAAGYFPAAEVKRLDPFETLVSLVPQDKPSTDELLKVGSGSQWIVLMADGDSRLRNKDQYITRQTWESDHPANYQRVFREPLPPEARVVHSVVVTYSSRPGVVTPDDFEFELLVPPRWMRKVIKRFYLDQGNSEFVQTQLNNRRKQAQAWYAPQAAGSV